MPRRGGGDGVERGRILAGLAMRIRLQHRSVAAMTADRLDADAFERLVVEELDALPEEAVARLENVVFVTEDEPEGGEPLLGRYEGTDLTHRERYGFGELPDRIVLFRRPLLAVTSTEAELRAEVRTTLLHEIGHYFGLDDDRLGELGWG